MQSAGGEAAYVPPSVNTLMDSHSFSLQMAGGSTWYVQPPVMTTMPHKMVRNHDDDDNDARRQRTSTAYDDV